MSLTAVRVSLTVTVMTRQTRQTRLKGSNYLEIGRITSVKVHQRRTSKGAERGSRAGYVGLITILELHTCEVVALYGGNVQVFRGSTCVTWSHAESRFAECSGTDNDKTGDQRSPQNNFST